MRWQWSVLASSLIAVVAACTHSGSVTCTDGKICSEGTTCALVTNPDVEVCARPEQLADCADKPTYAHCGTNGRCYDGVCLATACGNGRVDRADPSVPGDVGEACDDSNERSGDGCASNCLSDETCGNHVLDPVTGELCDDGNAIQHDGCDSTCKPERARWVQLDGNGPSARSFAALVYDARRQRVVMFGGQDPGTSQPLGDTWEWDGLAWSKGRPVTSPAPRYAAAMAYDAIRRRVLLFGGQSFSDYLGDTWEWDGTNWTQLVPLTAPTTRGYASMVFDPVNKRVVLYGGTGKALQAIKAQNDTWYWDGTTWARPGTTGPTGVVNETMAMAYDPVRGRVVAFAGAETWLLDTDTWTRATPTTAPPARKGGALAQDPTTGRLILFGGTSTTNTVLGDTWAWNGQTWTSLTPTGSPAARDTHYMATDVNRRRIVTFGGTTDLATYEWDGTNWLQHASDPVPAVKSVSAAFDPLLGRSYMFDAQSTWELASFSWHRVRTEPGVHSSTRLVYDESRRAVFMRFDTPEPATWRWDGSMWTDVTASSDPNISGFPMGWDGKSSRLLTFGGLAAGVATNDTWEWNDGWTLQTPAHRPTPRKDAALGWDPVHAELLMFGQKDDTNNYDTWAWTGDDWVDRTPTLQPDPNMNLQLAWLPSRKRLVVVTGLGTWEWDGAAWTQLAVPLAPGPRGAFALTRTNDGAGLILYGGRIVLAGTAEIWRLRWDGTGVDEACRENVDDDGDKLAGCADPDCFSVCTPMCLPGTACDQTAPHCGDGVCNTALENCRICPGDCACTPTCGDAYCDPGESAASCPGDCQ